MTLLFLLLRLAQLIRSSILFENCDRAMKDATIPYSKTAGNCLCTNIGFYWKCEREHRLFGWWNLLFWSALLYHASHGPKYLRCTQICWLWHPVSQKSEGISEFLTLQPKPWLMLTSGGDKRLTCLQKHPSSVGLALCRFVDWTLPSKWIFFRLKKRFHRARFQQLPIKISK